MPFVQFRNAIFRPVACSVGAQVLVIDMDPQGNASTALGVSYHEAKAETASPEVMAD